MPPLFTRENAADMAARSHAARKQRASLPVLTERLPSQSADPLTDPFALTLACACDETLDKLRRATKPSERAQLARCLRDLRETWHLATGKPRPGLTRPEQYRLRRGVFS